MLPRLPSSMHAGATTPADAARCTCRFSSRTTDGLPLIQGGSASALPVSRPAQRSLHVPACMVAELLNATLLSGVLQSMSLPPRTAPAATSRKRQLLGGIRTHQENAPFHGALRFSCWGSHNLPRRQFRGRENSSKPEWRPDRLQDSSISEEQRLTGLPSHSVEPECARFVLPYSNPAYKSCDDAYLLTVSAVRSAMRQISAVCTVDLLWRPMTGPTRSRSGSSRGRRKTPLWFTRCWTIRSEETLILLNGRVHKHCGCSDVPALPTDFRRPCVHNHVNGLAGAITAATGLDVHTNLALQTFT